MLSDLKRLDFRTNAAEDEQEQKYLLAKHGFVESPQYHSIREGGYRFIVARKGGGKTAVMLRLEQDAINRRMPVSKLNMGDFQPNHFFSTIQPIIDETGLGIPVFVRNMWRYTISLSLMKIVVGRGDIAAIQDGRMVTARGNIADFLETRGFGTTSDRTPELGTCTDIMRQYEYPIFRKDHLPSEAATHLPNGERFRNAESALADVLSHFDGGLALIDDIDKWIEASNYDRMVPFVHGLLEAAKDIEDKHLQRGKVNIRLFLPEDLYAKVDYRHDDKITHLLYLRHDAAHLRQMLARKINIQLSLNLRVGGDGNLKPEQIAFALSRIFATTNNSPKTIYDTWSRERELFEYIGMHTLYRPRDLWLVVQEIVDAAVREQHDLIDVNDIRSGCTLATSTLVQRIQKEYRFRMPKLDKLIQGFRDGQVAMNYVFFKQRLCEILDSNDEPTIQHAMEDLYEVGFFGKLVREVSTVSVVRPIVGHERKEDLEFSFRETQLQLIEGETVVVHPIYWAPLDLQPTVEPRVRKILEPVVNG